MWKQTLKMVKKVHWNEHRKTKRDILEHDYDEIYLKYLNMKTEEKTKMNHAQEFCFPQHS